MTETDVANQLMNNVQYGNYLKNLFGSVIDEKITPRLEKCEGEIHDIKCKMEKMEVEKEKSDASQKKLELELTQRLCKAEKELNEIQQYQRRNSLTIAGIDETEGENTDELVKNLAKEKLGVNLEDTDIEKCHRVGKPNIKAKKPRIILIKFTSYKPRSTVIKQRRKLKGSKITIQEDLTKQNQELLKKASRKPGVVSSWTQDGRVYVSIATSKPGVTRKIPIFTMNNLADIPEESEITPEITHQSDVMVNDGSQMAAQLVT